MNFVSREKNGSEILLQTVKRERERNSSERRDGKISVAKCESRVKCEKELKGSKM
jgi:hypothetical protein